MTQTKTAPNTLKISRVIKAPPERVYNAFLDPDALCKWLPPAGFTGKVHHLDPRVGGTFRMSFTSLDKKWSHAFGGEYMELKPHEKIQHTDTFETDDPGMQGEMRVTLTFKPVPEGTEVNVVQENIPKKIPVEDARQGWTSSLKNLAGLVEM